MQLGPREFRAIKAVNARREEMNSRLKALEELVDRYSLSREYDQAIECCMNMLGVYQEFLGTDEHQDTVRIYYRLSNMHLRKADFVNALANNEKALAINSEKYSLDPDHRSFLDIHVQKGTIYATTKDYDEAISEFVRALYIAQLAPANDETIRPAIAVIHHNLGNLLSTKGDFKQAIHHHQTSLDIQLELVTEQDPKHVEIISGYNSIGTCFARSGNYDSAISSHESALEVISALESKLAAHPRAAAVFLNPLRFSAYHNLASAYNQKGEYDKALEYVEQALSAAEGVEKHTDISQRLKDQILLSITTSQEQTELAAAEPEEAQSTPADQTELLGNQSAVDSGDEAE